MNVQNFNPYQEVIKNSIKSCITKEQLHCCWDMIERFKEVFTPMQDESTMIKATNILHSYYAEKSAFLPQ